MAQEILKVIKALPDGFMSYRADVLMKGEDGSSIYRVKGGNMGAVQETISVKKDGAALFAASWKQKDTSDKSPAMALDAFRQCSTDFAGSRTYAVELLPGDSTIQLQYLIRQNDKKVASFSFDKLLQQATLTVAGE